MDTASPAKKSRTRAPKSQDSQNTPQDGVIGTAEPETYPRIRRLTVRNFRCIGSAGVEVELDKIVVLVGANNSGKSAVLRAYEIALRSNEKIAELDIEEFPFHKHPKESNLFPEIILETVVPSSAKVDQKWKRRDSKTGEDYVTEKWTWSAPGKGRRIGWDKEINNWADREEDRVPFGWESVADAHRPEPLRISPFDSPEKIQDSVAKLLKARIKEQLAQSDRNNLKELIKLSQDLISSVTSETKELLDKMSDIIGRVFPQYLAKIDSPHEDYIEKDILEALIKIEPKLYLGTAYHQSPLGKQGSGAQRMLMWAALRCTAEQRLLQKAKEPSTRAYSLLIDEPELCLHPSAVREACSLLYEIAQIANWQVMITTHSPIFINLGFNNTSIVRVDREEGRESSGTTIYRPKQAQLGDGEVENLKLLTMYDPYVAEFFFAKEIIIVEGDTEYVAIKTIIANILSSESISVDSRNRYRDVHVLRARGKTNIASFCKILDHFTKPYSVLHDSDKPKNKNGDANSRWKDNETIREKMKPGTKAVAMIPNFETVFLSDPCADKQKPYEAFRAIKVNPDLEMKLRMLLDYLLGYGTVVPDCCHKSTDKETLEQAFARWTMTAEHATPQLKFDIA